MGELGPHSVRQWVAACMLVSHYLKLVDWPLGAKFNEIWMKITWWCHQIETFLRNWPCAGNSTVTSEFPTQRTVTGSFYVFFDLHLNKRLSKQSWGWWFESPSHPLWRHCNGFILLTKNVYDNELLDVLWTVIPFQLSPPIHPITPHTSHHPPPPTHHTHTHTHPTTITNPPASSSSSLPSPPFYDTLQQHHQCNSHHSRHDIESILVKETHWLRALLRCWCRPPYIVHDGRPICNGNGTKL